MILIEKINNKGFILGYNELGMLVARECIGCRELKSFSDFHKNKSKYGIVPICKICRKKKQEAVPKKRKRYYKVDSSGNLIERQCTDCLKVKSYEFFSKHAAGVCGVNCVCKECASIEASIYRGSNKQKIKKNQKKYYKENLEKVRRNVKEWRSKNKDKVYTYDKRIHSYQKINTKFKKQIQELKKLKKTANHVLDHIIPLKHKDVCGLNVPWNIQILTWSDNCSKSNKFDGTYENESWRQDL